MPELLVILAVLALLILVNALYVAGEFATVGARKSRVQELAERGDVKARRLLPTVTDAGRLDTYIAACQIGITLSSLIVGAYGQSQLTPLIEPYLGAWLGAATGATVSVLLVLVLLTGTQVVLGELLPKTVALRYPERLAMLTFVPVRLSIWVFRPLIALFNGSAFRIMRALNLNAEEHSHAHVHSPGELESIFTESARGGLIDAGEREMLRGILTLENRVAREVMTPRTKLVTVQADMPAREALRSIVTTPYTRFPVTEGGVDQVVGTTHVRDLYLLARRDPTAPVRTITTVAPFIPDSQPLSDVWARLSQERQHLAIVVDEYGGVAGMLTLEDALEEVFGELQDEFDQEEEPIVQLPGGHYSVRGDVLIDTLNARFELDLPTEDADTVSGLVWAELDREPHTGDEFSVGRALVRVESMDRRAVRRVLIAPEHEQEATQ